MRLYYIIPVLLLFTGCASNIIIEDINLTEDYDSTTNISTPQTLTFTIYNPSSKTADCNASFILEFEGEVIEDKKYNVGIIEPKSRVKNTLNFDMPFGDASFRLEPVCSFG